MAVRLDKPWGTFTEQEVARVGGQLGVFELADEQGNVVYIGGAGGRSLFGLRGELQPWLGSGLR